MRLRNLVILSTAGIFVNYAESKNHNKNVQGRDKITIFSLKTLIFNEKMQFHCEFYQFNRVLIRNLTDNKTLYENKNKNTQRKLDQEFST